jgi:hypothetical protein
MHLKGLFGKISFLNQVWRSEDFFSFYHKIVDTSPWTLSMRRKIASSTQMPKWQEIEFGQKLRILGQVFPNCWPGKFQISVPLRLFMSHCCSKNQIRLLGLSHLTAYCLEASPIHCILVNMNRTQPQQRLRPARSMPSLTGPVRPNGPVQPNRPVRPTSPADRSGRPGHGRPTQPHQDREGESRPVQIEKVLCMMYIYWAYDTLGGGRVVWELQGKTV